MLLESRDVLKNGTGLVIEYLLSVQGLYLSQDTKLATFVSFWAINYV